MRAFATGRVKNSTVQLIVDMGWMDALCRETFRPYIGAETAVIHRTVRASFTIYPRSIPWGSFVRVCLCIEQSLHMSILQILYTKCSLTHTEEE